MKKRECHIECYNFRIIDCEDKSCKIEFDDDQGDAFKKDRRKLYVIQDNKSILYVGEANCSIKKRFQRASYSFNHYARTDKARGGYKGYKWLNKALNSKRNLKVIVAIFSPLYDDDDKRSFIESIEGELVFLVRNKLSYWPKFQNEIHFSNLKGALQIAEDIFDIIKTPAGNTRK